MRGIPCATPLFGTFYAYEQSRGPDQIVEYVEEAEPVADQIVKLIEQ